MVIALSKFIALRVHSEMIFCDRATTIAVAGRAKTKPKQKD